MADTDTRRTTVRLTSRNADPPHLSIMVEMTGIHTQHIHLEIVTREGEAANLRNPPVLTPRRKKARFHPGTVPQTPPSHLEPNPLRSTVPHSQAPRKNPNKKWNSTFPLHHHLSKKPLPRDAQRDLQFSPNTVTSPRLPIATSVLRYLEPVSGAAYSSIPSNSRVRLQERIRVCIPRTQRFYPGKGWR